jgi:hypothetical protein
LLYSGAAISLFGTFRHVLEAFPQKKDSPSAGKSFVELKQQAVSLLSELY